MEQKNDIRLIPTSQNRPGLSDIHSKQNEIGKIEKTEIQIINGRNTDNGKMIPFDIIDKIRKSICKISYENNNGTGFFILLKNSFKCIMTNYHVISEINKVINIQIYNNKNININLNNRNIKYYNNLDITIIEIKESYEILKYIEFLDYDLNYIKGYEQYKNIDIFTLQYLEKEGICAASGNIIDILGNKYEFTHNIYTEYGSSGSPIILFNTLKVIGMHRGGDKNKKINYGTFIGEIFNENKNINNYIIGEIYITEKDIGKNIRIINSFEKRFRKMKLNDEIKEEDKNEKEIKECKIEINNNKIAFRYFYKFKKIGKYQIKYIFDQYLTKTNYKFCYCSSLTNLNLSNFNTQNVINMNFMFCNCSSLTNLNLSNFNTQNSINMGGMFCDCSSLTNLNLSNFNTQNVINMSHMFYKCSSLTNLNLSNFNTQNVIDMSNMFYKCSSLTNLTLSNFNTQNVTDMSGMFCDCSSLTNLNLSNFNTQNVTNMNFMFCDCSSLTNLISNFNTQNVTDMSYMFDNCKAFKINSIIK